MESGTITEHPVLGTTRCGDKQFRWGERTYIMGIINVTPDSFSGDGLGGDIDAALVRAERFVADGADVLDVGGESTRPGAIPISIDEELKRVIPVIERLADKVKLPICIDTYKAEVARHAITAGARMINDIWGLKHEPELARVAAKGKVPIILMHNQRGTSYQDLVPEVIASLRKSMEMALEAGVDWGNIIVDPGIGGVSFGKTFEHQLELMYRLEELKCLGRPILIGTSRKSVIGQVLNLAPNQRLEGTAATIAIGIAKGADIVRVHDVNQMARVVKMSDAIIRRGR